ncbi:MAG TPA: gluconate 2-dehydrogenase subunit 3 family protein, partial [Virgibacillus sp.]|nr:gluconate 2-dehydrogenase subunit 3 family protein [Virgibacillus sp.]
VAGGVIGGSLFGGLLGNKYQSDSTSKPVNVDSTSFQDARIFFNRKEDFSVLEAAVERIYPEDDNGPGAVELGVPFFIDRQLAGEYGLNSKSYMQGPFKDIDKTERYQTPLSRGGIMIEGIRKLGKASEKEFGEKFDEAEADQQDQLLQSFQDGEVKLKGVASETFFNLLVQMTIEGAYSDPVYGGNKNMQGWKMREYPGARPAYINVIEEEEFVLEEAISLTDYQP